MYEGRTIFSQLMEFLPRYEFNKCVERYRGNHWVKRLTCSDQFLCMAFAQLTHRESLRDIEVCLRAVQSKTYHSGFRVRVSRSTLADANEKRDWRIWADFANILIAEARELYANDDFGLALKETVYALDSTTIDLCLSLFPWAHFRKRKGAIKLHTLLDLRGSIPNLIIITNGKVHDVRILDDLVIEAGAIYLMDRAYVDFARLHRVDLSSAYFVTRAKSNFSFRRLYSREVDKATGVQCDQTIALKGASSSKDYPDCLRRIRFYDKENDSRLVFLTNNFILSAFQITKLYKARWHVELFFKWIKQHLRIKRFFGISENAVKTQVWIAISVYVLVAIAKKRLSLNESLYNMLQILDVSIFERMPLFQVLSRAKKMSLPAATPNQLELQWY